jgi:hypothetical protein
VSKGHANTANLLRQSVAWQMYRDHHQTIGEAMNGRRYGHGGPHIERAAH